jgi:DNA-binding MarR family transcriptional regulator
VVPLVMRAVAAELRASGELPAPAHFGLLSMLSAQPHARTLTELAALQGVSLPTMSNSISALVDRGWVQRTGAGGDRRQVVIEVTPTGRAALDRVSACAERHLAEVLAPLDGRSRRLVHQGLGRLRQVFGSQSRRARTVEQPPARRTHGRG